MLPAPTAWNLDPLTIVIVLVLLAAYSLALGPFRARLGMAGPPPIRRIVCFVAGWLTLALTLLSPLDTLGRYYLFSAHTLQLFILTTITSPLLMYGIPESLVSRLIPTRALRNATRGLLFSVFAALAFNVLIIIWHVGPLYARALHNPVAHDLQMLCFLLAGVLTWWPLLTPMDRHTRLSTPFQMLYLALESLPLDIFGVAVLFATSVLYPAYASAPRVISWLTPTVDQQVAGALLAVPGNLIDIFLISTIFFAWIADVERAQRERERILYADEDALTGATPRPQPQPAANDATPSS